MTAGAPQPGAAVAKAIEAPSRLRRRAAIYAAVAELERYRQWIAAQPSPAERARHQIVVSALERTLQTLAAYGPDPAARLLAALCGAGTIIEHDGRVVELHVAARVERGEERR